MHLRVYQFLVPVIRIWPEVHPLFIAMRVPVTELPEMVSNPW